MHAELIQNYRIHKYNNSNAAVLCGVQHMQQANEYIYVPHFSCTHDKRSLKKNNTIQHVKECELWKKSRTRF